MARRTEHSFSGLDLVNDVAKQAELLAQKVYFFASIQVLDLVRYSPIGG
jgi:hypothetical protein